MPPQVTSTVASAPRCPTAGKAHKCTILLQLEGRGHTRARRSTQEGGQLQGEARAGRLSGQVRSGFPPVSGRQSNATWSPVERKPQLPESALHLVLVALPYSVGENTIVIS